MPKEQQTQDLPNQAQENSNSTPAPVDVSRSQNGNDDDAPKTPSTYQDWASF